MRALRMLFLGVIPILVLAEACGSGGTTSVHGSIALNLTPTSATIQQGGSTQVSGTVVRTDFTGDIAISVTGAPSGITGVVTLAPVAGSNSAQVTISATSATAVGTYTLHVVASGSGVSSSSASLTLTVIAASASSFSMSLGSPSPVVGQGGIAASTITIVRTSFTGNITLSAENLPAGVTATFATSPVPGTSSSVTFTATSTAAPGSFNTVLIRATGAGVTDQTASITLTVTVTGSFTLVAGGNGSVSIPAGNVGNTTINAIRTGGFTGNIVYTATSSSGGSLPVGLTAALSPTGTADQNILTVTTNKGLTPGNYRVDVHGSAFGVTSTASVSVGVIIGANAIHLDYSLCPANARPVWVAVQAGSTAAPWTRVVGNADVYDSGILLSKGAIAMVMPGANFTTNVSYLSKDELGALSSGCTATTGGKTSNGTLNGVTSGFLASISMGGGSTLAVGPATTFQLTGVTSGAQDLVAYNRNPATPGAALDRVIIRRGLNIADLGSVTPVLDFTGVEALFPTTASITVAGATAGNTITHSQSYLTGAECTNHLLYSKTNTTTAIFVYGIPAANQVATDFYRLFVSEQLSATSNRSVMTSFHTLGDRTVTMGAAIASTMNDITGAGAYRRLESVVGIPSDYQSASLNYSGVSLNSVNIFQSAAYLGGASSATLSMPDLTSAGYLSSYGPAPANAVNFQTILSGDTGGGAACNEGGTTRLATVSGVM